MKNFQVATRVKFAIALVLVILSKLLIAIPVGYLLSYIEEIGSHYPYGSSELHMVQMTFGVVVGLAVFYLWVATLAAIVFLEGVFLPRMVISLWRKFQKRNSRVTIRYDPKIPFN